MKVGTDGILLGAWGKLNRPRRILDIGTGSGLISLMLAQRTETEKAKIIAVEIDKLAAEQARVNVVNSPWAKRIQVETLSIEDFQDPDPFDLIVCNPPFFEASFESPNQSRAQARHSETLTKRMLLETCSKWLTPEGIMCLIFPADQFDAFKTLVQEFGLGISRLTWVRPFPEKPPKRFLVEVARSQQEILEEELVLENVRHAYTDEFKALTSGFYLNH